MSGALTPEMAAHIAALRSEFTVHPAVKAVCRKIVWGK
jgi:hypothetical protein